jgi:hypothetical protein
MKELGFNILTVIIGAILLTMELSYCVVRDTIVYIDKILKKY